MLLTSKGAAGVAGGGFIALTATLATLGTVPAAGIMLIFGIDKFMSECRALVNFYGNAVATLVIAKWNKTLDVDQARRVLAAHTVPELSSVGDEDTVGGAVDHDDTTTVLDSTVTQERLNDVPGADRLRPAVGPRHGRWGRLDCRRSLEELGAGDPLKHPHAPGPATPRRRSRRRDMARHSNGSPTVRRSNVCRGEPDSTRNDLDRTHQEQHVHHTTYKPGALQRRSSRRPQH